MQPTNALALNNLAYALAVHQLREVAKLCFEARYEPGDVIMKEGDRGQSLVVWAINEGREAARECDRYLMGATALP